MEDEKFVSGYCRQIDGSRTVTVELENGRVSCVDCSYGSCISQQNCAIAGQIDEINA